MIGGRFHSFWHCAIEEAYARVLGATIGDPAFQAEWELLAVWISLEVSVAPLRLPEGLPRIVLRTDNTSVFCAAMEHRATSPVMIRLAAEIALQLECVQWEPIVGQHVPGLLNCIADQLRRLHQGAPMPLELQQANQVSPPTELKFRAWQAYWCSSQWRNKLGWPGRAPFVVP